MLLTHGEVELATPETEQVTELTVLVTGWLPFLILLPQKHQRQVLVGEEFVMQGCPVGRCPPTGYGTRMLRIEKTFKPFIVKVGR
jgi:hypothetical protein